MDERSNPEFIRRANAIVLCERFILQLPTAEIERLNVMMAETHPYLTLDTHIHMPDD